MKIVALIPARGGSKSLPGKNLQLLAGHPLLYWACAAAQQCKSIEKIYVSTDDAKIAGTAEAFGLDKLRVIGRAPETATDTASTESVLLDFAARVNFDYLILLQATSPLTLPEHIQAGLDMVVSQGYDSALSVVRQRRFHWAVASDGNAHPTNYDFRRRPRRQELAGYFVENGAVYVISRALLLKEQCRLAGRIGLVEMPEETYYELDEQADLAVLDALLRVRDTAYPGEMTARAARIKAVVSDVDGCLTDSGMYYGESGDEYKKFNTRDGKAVELLRNAGFRTALITNEHTGLVQRRGDKIRSDKVVLGASDKVMAAEELLADWQLALDELAFLGDDLSDLPLLRRCGLSACPADAVPEVRAAVDLVLGAEGGRGALREFAQLILNAKQAAAKERTP